MGNQTIIFLFDKVDRNFVTTVFCFAFLCVMVIWSSNKFNLLINNIRWYKSFADSALSVKLKAQGMDFILNPCLCSDSNGKVMFVNKRFEEVFQWKNEEILNNDFSNYIMSSEMKLKHKTGLNEYFLRGRKGIVDNVRGVDLPAIRKDGTSVPIKLFIRKFVEDGNTFFIGLMVDMTEQNKKDEELNRTLSLLKWGEQQNKTCTWTMDILKNRVDGSPNFYDVFDSKYIPGDDVRYGETVLKSDREKLENLISNAILECKGFETEYRVFHRQNGMQTINTKTVVETDANGKSIFLHGTSTVIKTEAI